MKFRAGCQADRPQRLHGNSPSLLMNTPIEVSCTALRLYEVPFEITGCDAAPEESGIASVVMIDGTPT